MSYKRKLKKLIHKLFNRSSNQNEAYEDEIEPDDSFSVNIVPQILSPTDVNRTPAPTTSSSPQRKPILVAQVCLAYYLLIL